MIKMMATARRRPGMTHSEYLAYNVDVHGTKTRDYPVGIRRYVQSHVLDACFGRTGDPAFAIDFGRDGVSELYFDDIGELARTFTDPRVQQDALKDGPNYVDMTATISMIADETEIEVASPGGGKLKICHFLRRKPESDVDEFGHRWLEAHRVAVESSGIGPDIRRIVWSRPSPEGEPFVAAMGQSIAYDGVASFWFDHIDTGAKAFRAYVDAIEGLTDDPIDHSTSFFLMTHELTLFDRSNIPPN